MITFTAILTIILDIGYVVYCIRKEYLHNDITVSDLTTCIVLLIVSIIMATAIH